MILLALNRRYFPTFKWIHQTIKSMQVKPEEIDRRFRKAYETTYAEAIEDTKSILEEIVHLVEEQFPQIDTSLVYRRLSYLRAAQNVNAHAAFPKELSRVNCRPTKRAPQQRTLEGSQPDGWDSARFSSFRSFLFPVLFSSVVGNASR